MHQSLFAAACLLVAQAAVAQSSISLSPAVNSQEVLVEETTNYTGTCGPAAVLMHGVKTLSDTHFTIDYESAKLVIRVAPESSPNPPRQLVFTADDVLSDYNGIACLEHQSSHRLLLWTNCNGSVCGEDNAYYVIDPEKPELLAPKVEGASCDAECAEQLVGDLPPQSLHQ